MKPKPLNLFPIFAFNNTIWHQLPPIGTGTDRWHSNQQTRHYTDTADHARKPTKKTKGLPSRTKFEGLAPGTQNCSGAEQNRPVKFLTCFISEARNLFCALFKATTVNSMSKLELEAGSPARHFRPFGRGRKGAFWGGAGWS